RAFSGEEAKHPGRRRGDQLDEPVHRDAPRVDAAVEDQGEAIFHTRQPVWDLGEIAPSHLLLSLEMEWTMVGRDQLQVILDQALPELIMVRLGSKRRRADILRAFEARPAEVFEAQIQVLRAGLGKGRS